MVAVVAVVVMTAVTVMGWDEARDGWVGWSHTYDTSAATAALASSSAGARLPIEKRAIERLPYRAAAAVVPGAGLTSIALVYRA